MTNKIATTAQATAAVAAVVACLVIALAAAPATFHLDQFLRAGERPMLLVLAQPEDCAVDWRAISQLVEVAQRRGIAAKVVVPRTVSSHEHTLYGRPTLVNQMRFGWAVRALGYTSTPVAVLVESTGEAMNPARPQQLLWEMRPHE